MSRTRLRGHLDDRTLGQRVRDRLWWLTAALVIAGGLYGLTWHR